MSHLTTKPTKWHAPSEDISARASVQSDQSSLCAQRETKDLSFLHADSEDSDQTGLMPGLICLRWVHIPFFWFCHKVANLCLPAYITARQTTSEKSQLYKKEYASHPFQKETSFDTLECVLFPLQ